MTNINLTRRQSHIIDNIAPCASLADVGCDHGYIGIEAMDRALTDRLYLCDISAPSLNKATSLATQLGMSNVSYHCQDGIGNINCQCAVIAGMGGQEIMSILDKAIIKPTRLVLQPMRNCYNVRQYLLTNNYKIIRDYIVQDGKFYAIIVAEQGQGTMQTELQLTLGISNLDKATTDFENYLQLEISKCNNILQHTHVPQQYQRRQLLLEAQQLISTIQEA